MIGLHDDGERARANLRHVSVHDTRAQERCGAHQFEELDVIVTVEGCVDGRSEVDVVRLSHLVTELLHLPGDSNDHWLV